MTLYRVTDVDAELAAVTENSFEGDRVRNGGDDLDVAYPGHHQRGQRVVDHRFVVDRQQLLADTHGDRVQPRTRTAGQDDSPHQSVLTQRGQRRSVRSQRALLPGCRDEKPK